jgi:hypothetical protein
VKGEDDAAVACFRGEIALDTKCAIVHHYFVHSWIGRVEVSSRGAGNSGTTPERSNACLSRDAQSNGEYSQFENDSGALVTNAGRLLGAEWLWGILWPFYERLRRLFAFPLQTAGSERFAIGAPLVASGSDKFVYGFPQL